MNLKVRGRKKVVEEVHAKAICSFKLTKDKEPEAFI